MQLAAAYRIFVQLGWQALIYKHISLRVPNEPGHLLLNPFGLHYSEVCASNLLKVDVRGNTVGHSVWPINPAGFTFHGLMWLLQRACEVQVASQPLDRLRPIATPVLEGCVRDSLNFNPRFGAGQDVFDAMQRLVDRADPSYRG